MKPFLVKIVDAILRHIEENPHTIHTEKGIRRWLKELGYTKRDIDSALRLLKPHFPNGFSSSVEKQTPVARPLTDLEIQKMRPAARDMLARLEMYGLIDPYLREAILEKVSVFDGTVGVEELEYLLAWLVFSVRDVETQHTFLRVIQRQEEPFN
ncbi:MAG TPA: DUF494 family protein [Candidatus Hydrogenedentes bacterium]|nr:DUF494 family protein [Candidatus Hydrogenedentota bacterium]HOL75696.1 DUF494 family protein [Candidatus Hydrogenedentota bacterium]HPO84311.1 DUF494 family protein [Candidatus Hydrogenedentota bacterium]